MENETQRKPREIWNAERAGEYLGLDASTVRSLARKKKLPGRQIGSTWRFYRDELENLPTLADVEGREARQRVAPPP